MTFFKDTKLLAMKKRREKIKLKSKLSLETINELKTKIYKSVFEIGDRMLVCNVYTKLFPWKSHVNKQGQLRLILAKQFQR